MKTVKNENKKISIKAGQLPGNLMYTGHKSKPDSKQQLIVYNETKADFYENVSFDEIIPKLKTNKVNWIHFNSLHNIELIEKAGTHFNIHPLILEDILSSEHLPKVEFFEDNLFLTLKMLTLNKNGDVEHEHISFILNKNCLLSFQELPGDLFISIKDSILNQKGKVRKNGSDYLFYLLIDFIVDNYLVFIEKLHEQLDKIEDHLIEAPYENHIHQIHNFKRKLIFARKYIFPLLEAVQNIIIEEPAQISEANYKYLSDIKDNVKYINDLIESYREDQRSLIELNQSNQSNSMNQVMKTLTIVASIFIPLTFIVGVYGMNFHYMPELTWKWGYFGVMGFMAVVTVLMVWYMKRKKWF